MNSSKSTRRSANNIINASGYSDENRISAFLFVFFDLYSNEVIDKMDHLFDDPYFYLFKRVDNRRCPVVVFRSCPREKIKQLKIIVDMQS